MVRWVTRNELVSQQVLPAMDLAEMVTQPPVGVQLLQTNTHTTHTLSVCLCMGPILRIPWTDGVEHHAPPVAVIGADPAPQGHTHTYTGSVHRIVQILSKHHMFLVPCN